MIRALSPQSGYPRPEQYVFWRYDQYPYYLGGRVVRAQRATYGEKQGWWEVETVEYGVGQLFTPSVVASPDVGRPLLELILELRQDKRDMQEAVNQLFQQRLARKLRETEGDDELSVIFNTIIEKS